MTLTPEERVATLTPRELDVARLAARGFSARYIARRYGISDRTVEVHSRHIYEKLLVSTRDALIESFADLLLARGGDPCDGCGRGADRCECSPESGSVEATVQPELDAPAARERLIGDATAVADQIELAGSALAARTIRDLVTALATPPTLVGGEERHPAFDGVIWRTPQRPAQHIGTGLSIDGPALHIASPTGKALCGLADASHVTDGRRYADCPRCIALFDVLEARP